MDWKSVLARTRKELNARLTSAGFVFAGQKRWHKQLGFWLGEISFEVTSRDGGRGRTVRVGVTLNHRKRLTAEEAKAQNALVLTGYTNYANYTIWFPMEVDLEWWANSPEELDKIREDVLIELDRDWLPWLERQSIEQGENLEGVRRYHEGVREPDIKNLWTGADPPET